MPAEGLDISINLPIIKDCQSNSCKPLNLISLYSNCNGQVFSLWVYVWQSMCARLQTSSAGLNLNIYTCTRMCCVVSIATCSLNKLVLELSQLSKYHSYRSVPTNLHLSVPKQLKICLDREDFKTSFEGFQQ